MALKLLTEGKTPTVVHTLSDTTKANERKYFKKPQLFTLILDRMSGLSIRFSVETWET